MTRLLVSLVLAATLGVAASPAAGATLPDLSVKRVPDPPSSLDAGQQLTAAVTVRNRGSKAGRSRVALLLSRDARQDGGDLRLGVAAVKPLRRGGSVRVSARGTVPASAPAASYRLLACADGSRAVRERNKGNNCRASARSVRVQSPAVPAPQAPSTPAPSSSPPMSGGPLGSPGTTPPAPGTRRVTGWVVYSKRDCTQGPASLAPLANASIRLTSASGQAVVESLGSDGGFVADVPGDGAISAVAITDGARISVTPDVEPARPYEIALGELTQQNQTLMIGGGPGNTQPDPASGAANIYSVLDAGARLAKEASPVPLPKVRVRWRYAGDLTGWLGDHTPSHYDGSTDEIQVGGTLHQGRRDEWAAFPLLHEYAHHVMKYVANPPDAFGSHGFDTTHRDSPALPWSEGFANFFAALGQNNPQLTLGCTVRVDLSAKPAVARLNATDQLAAMPLAGQEHLAQYNETAVAGSMWSLVHVLGSNVPTAGFATLLDALHAFKLKYHAPRDMREVRDAVTEFADGASEALQQEIGNAFDDHRLRWGFHFEEISQTVNAPGSGWVVPWAVGASCDMPRAGTQDPLQSVVDGAFLGPIGTDANGVRNHHGQVMIHGPLTHTRHDECWEIIRGRVLDANATVLYSLLGTLPYRPDQAHRNGRTIIGVIFRCASGAQICAGASRTVTIRVGTGIWHRPNGQARPDAAQPLNPRTVTVTVPAISGREATMADIVPVAEIDALGYCRTLVGPPQDCGN